MNDGEKPIAVRFFDGKEEARLKAEIERLRKLADDAIENVMMCVCTTAYTDHAYYTKWCDENHSTGDTRKALGWA